MFKRYRHKTDEELMHLIQSGHESAFDVLYRRHSQRLLHFMYRMVNHDEAKAQDLLHDLFLQLIERPETYDINRPFRPWIYTVAANLCRKTHRQPQHVDLEDQPLSDVEESWLLDLDRLSFKADLKKALQLLNHDQRLVFVLRFQEKLSLKDIAAIVDCAEGTVKSRLFHAGRKLAQLLRQYHPTENY